MSSKLNLSIRGFLIFTGLICSLSPCSAFTLLREDFEGEFGASDSLFSDIYRSGSGQFVHDDLSEIANSPAGAQIPISRGGDRELRYFEGDGGIAGGHSMIVSPSTSNFSDSLISGYVGFSFDSIIGGVNGGFMSRVSGFGSQRSGYVASVVFHAFGPNTVAFGLGEMIQGVVGGGVGFSLVSGGHALDFSEENVYIELLTEGDLVEASFWRVEQDGERSFLETLAASDTSYRDGANGLYAFARGENSVLFDDVSVLQIPEPSISLLLMMPCLALWRRRRYHTH